MRRFFLILSLATVMMVGMSATNETIVKYYVEVIDAYELPLEGAIVIANDAVALNTDKDGLVIFNLVVGKEVTFRVLMEGYHATSTKVTVSSDTIKNYTKIVLNAIEVEE